MRAMTQKFGESGWRGAVVGLSLSLGLFTGCGAGNVSNLDSSNLVSADENATTAEAITASYPVGSVLRTTSDLNLRAGPSSQNSVRLVIPSGASVTVVSATVSSGWYNIKYGSTTGYSYGGYLKLVSTPGTSGGSSSAVDQAVARAKDGVGYSYWWGHGMFNGSSKGACQGSCPSCSHQGSGGADCSGYVAKVWVVPSDNAPITSDSHPYSTVDFDNEQHGWSTVSRSSARKMDAYVYNSNGAGHIFLYESGTPWGSLWSYEARGCSYGIVHNVRTAGTGYKVIRHYN